MSNAVQTLRSELTAVYQKAYVSRQQSLFKLQENELTLVWTWYSCDKLRTGLWCKVKLPKTLMVICTVSEQL